MCFIDGVEAVIVETNKKPGPAAAAPTMRRENSEGEKENAEAGVKCKQASMTLTHDRRFRGVAVLDQ